MLSAIPNKIIVEIPTYHPETNTFNWNKKTINLYDSNENPIWMEHCEYKEKMDVVAIKLDENIIDKGVLRTLPYYMGNAGGMDAFFAACLEKK